MNLYNKALIWSFLIIGIATYNVWIFIGDKSFYVGLSIVMLVASLFMLNNSRGFTKRIALLAVATTFSTLIDELLFTPTVFAWNDYILLPIAFLITYIPKINARFQT